MIERKESHLLSRAAVEEEYDELNAFPLNAPLLKILIICP